MSNVATPPPLPQGPTGAKGPTGPNSSIIFQGPTGFPGPRGPAVLVATGSMGPTGNFGPTGPQATTLAVTGSLGPTGQVGMTGPQGFTGAVGTVPFAQVVVNQTCSLYIGNETNPIDLNRTARVYMLGGNFVMIDVSFVWQNLSSIPGNGILTCRLPYAAKSLPPLIQAIIGTYSGIQQPISQPHLGDLTKNGKLIGQVFDNSPGVNDQIQFLIAQDNPRSGFGFVNQNYLSLTGSLNLSICYVIP